MYDFSVCTHSPLGLKLSAPRLWINFATWGHLFLEILQTSSQDHQDNYKSLLTVGCVSFIKLIQLMFKFLYCHFPKKKKITKVITIHQDKIWNGNNTIIKTELKLSCEIFLPCLHQSDWLDISVIFIWCGPQLSNTNNMNTNGRSNSDHLYLKWTFLSHSHQIHLGKMWLELLCQLSHLLQKVWYVLHLLHDPKLNSYT